MLKSLKTELITPFYKLTFCNDTRDNTDTIASIAEKSNIDGSPSRPCVHVYDDGV